MVRAVASDEIVNVVFKQDDIGKSEVIVEVEEKWSVMDDDAKDEIREFLV